MFDFFQFSLPRAVTEQLIERLDQMETTPLGATAIADLRRFSAQWKTAQGVYLIYVENCATYAGKAVHLADRLEQHLRKLRGRKNIDLNAVAFKALLLDENWSTSANEDLLIEHYRSKDECSWNKKGFGPKDPGQGRDDTRPSWFDTTFPVNELYPVVDIPDEISVANALGSIKGQLPYLMRYEEAPEAQSIPVNFAGVPRNARDVLKRIAEALGREWQLMLLPHGFTLYKGSKTYRHGVRLFP
ncbi:MAG TPA: Eco29kI family restriction endonuclease [Methylomirabilota bacterium]|nr:Eco29kI family restriction endonuclease [Methylomirabilota bacterium]